MTFLPITHKTQMRPSFRVTGRWQNDLTKKCIWIESGLPVLVTAQPQIPAPKGREVPHLSKTKEPIWRHQSYDFWGQDSGPPQDLKRTQDSSSIYSSIPVPQDLAWQRKRTNNVTRHWRPHLNNLVTLQFHLHGLFPLAVFVNNEDEHPSTPPAPHTHTHAPVPTFSLVVNPQTYHGGLYLESMVLKRQCASESPGRFLQHRLLNPILEFLI